MASYRTRFLIWAFLAFGLVTLVAPQAWAKSKYIRFERMMDRCDVVAVARFPDGQRPAYGTHSAQLDLTRIIKGTIQPGKYKVSFVDYPSVGKDVSEFVAFFRDGLCWRFVAEPISKGTVTDSDLAVRGFYDFNAYFVSPGLVSLDQIQAFVKDRTLAYTFRGPLCFPERGRAAWQASTLEMEVVYDAVKDQCSVKGLPELRGFPARPRISIGGSGRFPNRTITLTYADYTDLALVIAGDMQDLVPKSGVMRTKFYVTRPDLLSQKDFENYVSDPGKGNTYYTVKLTCASYGVQDKSKVLTFTQGRESGVMGLLEGWAENGLRLTSFGSNGPVTTMTAKLETGEELVLRFDDAWLSKGPDVFQWTFQEGLLYRLLVSDIQGKVLMRRGGVENEITTCTASLSDVVHKKQDPPRTELNWPDENTRPSASEYDPEAYVDCRVPEDGIRPWIIGLLLIIMGATGAGLVVAVICGYLVRRRRA